MLEEFPSGAARGAFPTSGPVTYLTDDLTECHRMMTGPHPSVRVWYHGTSEEVARLACVQGIAPGCWTGRGGECCGVTGYNSLEDFLLRAPHLWIIEIESPALEGEIKAWWVPHHNIRGVWHLNSFKPRAEFASSIQAPLTEARSGCHCGLSAICSEQQVLWRSTWATRERM